jgi:predicted ATPase/class 3 adenylate cyclase
VTFLFTDIVASTRLWEQFPASMPAAFAQHERLLRQACQARGGFVYKMVGDALQVAFASAVQAALAARDAQLALLTAAWGETGPLAVRMALHSGQTEERSDDYVGPLLNRLARMLDAGTGGQILVSQDTAILLESALPVEMALRDLGEHRLKYLTRPERIYQLVAPDLPARFPPIKTLAARPNNLPSALNSFIGRSKELTALGALLRRPYGRLVTLTGPGGMGKTRLAMQVASDQLAEFPDGVFWIALDTLNDPDQVLPAIARALGVAHTPLHPLIEALKVALRERSLLLVIDNFEHLLEAAPVLTTLLQAAPQLKIFVTSRVRLNLYGEHQFSLAALALPPQEIAADQDLTSYDAIHLFVERIRNHSPDWSGGPAEQETMHAICAQLDGMPLALELAAAHAQQYSLAEILAQLTNRLAFLTNGPRDVHSRQRTLRATLDWSYASLPPTARVIFSRLGIFHGGWTPDMLAAVCSDIAAQDVQDALVLLVAQHLVYYVGAEPAPRYAILETMREYARELLRASGATEVIAARHTASYLALVEKLAANPAGPGQEQAMQQMIAEQANLRAAIQWSLDHDQLTAGARFCAAMWRYTNRTGQNSEGWQWSSRILARIEQVEDRYRAAFFHAAGAFAHFLSLYNEAARLWNAALSLRVQEGDTVAQGHLRGNLGVIALHQGRYHDAEALYTSALALFRRCDSAPGIGRMLNNLAVAALLQGDHHAALALFDEGIRHYRKHGNEGEMTALQAGKGQVYFFMGRYDDAKQCLMLYINAAPADVIDMPETAIFLGLIAVVQKNAPAAVRWLQQGLETTLRRAEPRSLVLALDSWAMFFQDRNPPAATWMLGLADRIIPADAPRPPHMQGLYAGIRQATQAALGEEAWQQAWAYGASVALDQIEGLIQSQLQTLPAVPALAGQPAAR